MSAPPVRLSIVTVCWNDLANVQRTMQSIERQTERLGWEHILVDGNSSDGTAEWYRSADFSFPHRAISEPDNGIFDAMNKSVALAEGDYVVFMNAGDRYADADVIGRTLRRIQASSPAWGYGKAQVVDDLGRRVRPQIGKIPYSRLHHLFGVATICHQAVVMRIELFTELGGFDLRMENAADYHLLVKAAARAAPVTWDDLDVDYLAGGVSESEIFDSLRLRHRVRTDALELHGLKATLDAAWCEAQVGYIKARKKLKPLLGPAYLRLRK